MVKVRKKPTVGWVGGMRKGRGLVRATVSSRIFSYSPALAVTCHESVSSCILVRAEVTLGGAGPYGVIPAFTGPMRHLTHGAGSALGQGLCPGPRWKQPCPHVSISGDPHPARPVSQPFISLLMAHLHAFAQVLPMSTHPFFQTSVKVCPLLAAFLHGPSPYFLLGGSMSTYRLFPQTYTVSRLYFCVCSLYLPKEMIRSLRVGITSYIFSVSHIIPTLGSWKAQHSRNVR